MSRTTTTASGRIGRVTGALAAAALAGVGVIATDVPASVVTASTVNHVSTLPAEPGAASPTHVPRRLG